jgi:branched-chain amino acid transport system substrate-binding protein
MLGRLSRLGPIATLASALLISTSFAADPIKVGVMANLTGTDVASSVEMTRGVELGAEAVNAAGGVNGAPIELITEDSQYQTQEALNAASKLYDVDGVQAVIMFGGSSLMLAVAEVAKQDGRIIINTSSSSPKLGDYPGTIFSILPLDDIVGKELGTWVYSKGLTTAAFVAPNNTFGGGIVDAAAAAFEAAGGTVLAKVAYTEGQPDYRADIQPLVALAPQAIIAVGYGDDSRTVFKNARELGLDAPWYTAYPSIFTVENPEWMNGRLFGIDNGGISGAKAQEVAAAYTAKYGEGTPTPHVYYAYDAVQLLAKAMTAGGTEAAQIAAALPGTVAGYDGATGTITWDDRGQRIDPPMDFFAYKDGALVTIPK